MAETKPVSSDPLHIAVSKSKGLKIDWSDGHHSEYELVYLRDECPCATCTGAHGTEPQKSGYSQPQQDPFQLYQPKLRMVNIEEAGTYALKINWSDGHSAGIYSTGVVTLTGATVMSLGDCGGVIDGANSITLLHAELIGQQHGIKIWKTAPGAGSAVVLMREGWLTSGEGSAFYVTAETGNAASAAITVKEGATVDAGNGNILSVLGASSATLTLDGVELSGSLYADAAATAAVTLQNNARLAGAASGVGMTMDASCVWFVTSNSVLTSLVDSAGVAGSTITNIVGNGYNVHYDPNLAANSYLGGLVYTLVRGGVLTPDIVPVEATSWGAIKTLFRGK